MKFSTRLDSFGEIVSSNRLLFIDVLDIVGVVPSNTLTPKLVSWMKQKGCLG